MEGNSFSANSRPGFGRRLGRSLYRILRAFLITMVILAVLAGVAWGGLWLYQVIRGEINRSADSVTARFDAQESRIDILRREMDTLLSANPGQEEKLNALGSQLEELNDTLAALNEDMDQQSDMLAALDASMSVTLENDAASAQDIADLGAGLTALQGDFNATTAQVDAFGGELDGLTGEVSQTQLGLQSVEATAVSAAEQADLSQTAVSEMAQSLALFRAWELVARARLRLLENNFGLASADVDEASETITAVIDSLPPDSASVSALEIVQTRLALAADSLPGNPEQANVDLESVWDALDEFLVARLLPPPAAELSPTATPGG